MGITFRLSREGSETIFFSRMNWRDADEIGLDILLQLAALRMLLGNFVEHLADDFVFAVAAGEIGMVAVAGKHLRVHGQRELQHFGADGFQLLLGIGEKLIGRDVGFHHEAEFLIVEIFAEAPGARGRAFAEIVREPLREVLQRSDGGRRDALVFGLERRAVR